MKIRHDDFTFHDHRQIGGRASRGVAANDDAPSRPACVRRSPWRRIVDAARALLPARPVS